MVIPLTITHEHTVGYGTQLAYGTVPDLWAASDGVQLHLWQGDTLQKSIEIGGHQTGDVRISADNRMVYLAPLCYDLHAHTFVELPPIKSVFTAGLTPEGQSAEYGLRGAVWSPDGQSLLLSVQYQPSRRLGSSLRHDVPRKRLLVANRQAELQHILWQDSDYADYITLAYEKRFIAAAGMPIRVYETRNFAEVAILEGHTTTLRDLAFNADESLLMSAGWDGQVILWQTETWQILAQWHAHAESASAVAFHPQAQQIMTGGEDAQLKIWSIATQPELLAALTVGSTIEAIAFAPDGSHFLAATDDGRILRCTLG